MIKRSGSTSIDTLVFSSNVVSIVVSLPEETSTIQLADILSF